MIPRPNHSIDCALSREGLTWPIGQYPNHLCTCKTAQTAFVPRNHARKTIAVLQQFIASNIDRAERLEMQMEDLESDLRDAPNDFASHRATVALTVARNQQREAIHAAARDLRSVDALRTQAGLDATVLMRIFAELHNKGATNV